MNRWRTSLSRGVLACAVALVGVSVPAAADTIDPTSFSASLAVGESVTLTKTVVVDEVTTGVIDVMFLFDTSGSMGPYINAAKIAANDILAGLASFGDLATGTGYYSEPGSDGVVGDLTTNTTQQLADINAITLGLGGNGGDFPEEGVFATFDAATNTSWRPASNRFIIALGDATFKESDGATVAGTLAALDDNNVTFIGINFLNMTTTAFGGISPAVFGDIFAATTDPDSIVDAIVASITASFATYTSVTVDDLDGGLPGVGVSVTCVSADGAACSGSTATGSWTRDTARTFTFDVTFTGLTPGVHSFPTHALVDGGIVASESDRITVDGAVAPEPTTLSLLGLALGLASARRIRRRATA